MLHTLVHWITEHFEPNRMPMTCPWNDMIHELLQCLCFANFSLHQTNFEHGCCDTIIQANEHHYITVCILKKSAFLPAKMSHIDHPTVKTKFVRHSTQFIWLLCNMKTPRFGDGKFRIFDFTLFEWIWTIKVKFAVKFIHSFIHSIFTRKIFLISFL